MFSAKTVVSNVPLSNAGEVFPGLMTDSPDLLVAQDHQTQCLSNDDAVTRARTEGKAMDNFRVALADASEAAFFQCRKWRRENRQQAGRVSACSARLDCSPFVRAPPDVRRQRDIDSTALDSTHGLKKHEPAVNKKFYPCSICGANFNRQSKLECHARIHTGERPFRCDDCSYSGRSKPNLVYHRKKHHGDGALYKCNVCHQDFPTSAHLVRHKRFHDITRPYSCEICALRFMTQAVCLTHMTHHDDRRLHRCNLCNRTFKSIQVLNQHQAVHSNDRNFYCHCGAIYKSNRSLIAHKKSKHSERQDAILNDSHELNKYQISA